MFLRKFSDFVVKYKNIILIVMAVILILAILGTVFLITDKNKINSDMMSYMGEDFETSKGLAFLQKNFDIKGDVMIVVRGEENDDFIRNAVKNIHNKSGVRQVIWADDALVLEDMKDKFSKIEMGDFKDLTDEQKAKIKEILENYVKDNQDALSTFDKLFMDFKTEDFYALMQKLMNEDALDVDTSGLINYLKRPIEGTNQYDYVIMVMINLVPSTSEASQLLNDIKAEFGDRTMAASGMTETSQVILQDTLQDLPNFLIYAVIAVLIILIATTPSFMDPLILILTLGVSIIISMGVNYLYPSISIISFATSAILQLAITMDYAIFYMHTYNQRRQTLDALSATKAAIPEVTTSILASALTTVGGFAALYFMRFGIGADIANVIIKGVILSLLTVLLLQPILTLYLDKAVKKTTHHFIGKIEEKIRVKRPDYKGVDKHSIVRPVAKFSVWARIGLIVVAVALLVPTFIAQSKVKMSYFEMYEQAEATTEEALAKQLGNQIIITVPLKTKIGSQQDFIDDILADPNKKVTGLVSAFTSIKGMDGQSMTALLKILNNPDFLKTGMKYIPEELIDELKLAGMDLSTVDVDALIAGIKDMDLDMLNSYFSLVDVSEKVKSWYTLYTISIQGSAEDDAAAASYRYIKDVCKKYFGVGESYSIGMVTGSYDMRITTPTDFLTVTIISAVIIFLIVALLLRNPLKSLIMVILIELGIWINLSITFLFGQQINFMVYIIISSVQLGCTVDYAILLANTFEHNRSKYSSSKECAINSALEAVPAIITSSLIIITVCLVVYLVSNNLIIKQLTGMLARGAGISVVLVTLVQTAIMSFYKLDRRKYNFEHKLKEVEGKLDENQKLEEEIIKNEKREVIKKSKKHK